MADSTTFGGGDDVPLFAPETPRRRSTDRANIDSLRGRVRELGHDLRRNWTDTQTEPSAETPMVRPVAHSNPARKDWADRLAEEYSEDFLLKAPARPASAVPVVEEAEERHVLADRAYAVGRLLFAASAAVGPVAAPVIGVFFARRGLVLKVLLGALLALAVPGLLRDWPRPDPQAPAAAPAPAIAWIEIARPYPLFALSSPILGNAQPLYTARRHSAGGGREDVLTFGQLGDQKAFLRLGIYRHGTEEAADPGYFVDMARRAAASGLGVTQADLPQALQTRFGAFESASLELSGPAGVKGRNCRGFRLEVAQPALTLGGFLCGGAEKQISAAELSCVIERIDLLAAGQDRALADFFGAAGSRKSRACAQATRRK
jgi:hypothetical protein